MSDYHEHSLADESPRSHSGSSWMAIKAIARTLLERLSLSRIRARRRAKYLAELRNSTSMRDLILK
jgi:hypothetical protein